MSQISHCTDMIIHFTCNLISLHKLSYKCSELINVIYINLSLFKKYVYISLPQKLYEKI